MILITGATGYLGTAVIDHLLTKVNANEIAALVRNPEGANLLLTKGIDIRIGDYNNINSLEKAMDGIDKVLLVSSPENQIFQQHKNVIDVAKKHGVKQLVYTSLLVKNIEISPLKTLLEGHKYTEDYLKESGVPYTVLKNTMYADAIPLFVGDNVMETGIHVHAGNGKVPFALRREIGEAAANSLIHSEHINKEYSLTASELYSYTDVATALSIISGKNVVYYSTTDLETYEDKLRQAGLPELHIPSFSAFITDKKNGVYEILSDDLEKLLGRRPMALTESLKEIYSL